MFGWSRVGGLTAIESARFQALKRDTEITRADTTIHSSTFKAVYTAQVCDMDDIYIYFIDLRTDTETDYTRKRGDQYNI